MSSASFHASECPSVSLTSARMIVTWSAFGGSLQAGTIQPRSAASCEVDVELNVVVVAFELERDQRELLGALVADQPELRRRRRSARPWALPASSP